MSGTSPTLTLKVTADHAGIAELKALLKELKSSSEGLNGLMQASAGETAAILRGEELLRTKHNNTMELLEAKHQSKITKAQDEADNIRSANTRKIMLTSAKMTTKFHEDSQKNLDSNLLKSEALNRTHYQTIVAEAYKMNAALDAISAQKLVIEQATNTKSEALNRTHYQTMVAEAYKMNTAFDAVAAQKLATHKATLVKEAELDIAYGQMSLARQIKMRKEIAAVQSNPALGASFAKSSFAPAAIGDTRSILEMESALRSQGVAATGAAEGHNKLNGMMREGHSLARGMAGPLGAMWLTWGSIIPLLAGAGITSAVKGAISSGADFEMTLARLKGVTQETDAAIKSAGESIKNLSKDSMFGPKETAEGVRILAQAGLSLKESLQTLPTVLKLAAVGELNMSEAAEIATGTMHAFGLSVKDLPGIANVLTKAADMSQTNIKEMGEAMKQGSTVALQYGVNLVDMSTSMAVLAQVNIRGSAAGTAFKNMMNNLAAPTKHGAQALKDLGVKTYDAHNELKKMPELMRELEVAFAKFNPKEQARLMSDLLNERGSKGLQNQLRALSEGTFTKFNNELKEAAKNSDYLDQKYKLLTETFSGQATSAFNSFKVALIDSFQSSAPELLKLAQRMKEFAQSPEIREGLKSLIKSFATLATWLADHAELVGNIFKVWAGYKVVTLAAGAFNLLTAGLVAGSTALKTFAGLQAAAKFVGWTEALVGVRGGMALLSAVALPEIAVALALGAGAWWLWQQAGEKAATEVGTKIGETLKQAKLLGSVNYKFNAGDSVKLEADIAESKKAIKDLETLKASGTQKPGKNLWDKPVSYDTEIREQKQLLALREKNLSAIKPLALGEYAAKVEAKPEEPKGSPQEIADRLKEARTKAEMAAETLRAAENNAKNLITRDNYTGQIALAKEELDHTIALDKIKFSGKQQTEAEFFANSEAAYAVFNARELQLANKLNDDLLGSEKLGEGKLNELRKQAVTQRAALGILQRAAVYKNAQEEAIAKTQVEAKAFLDSKAATLARLNSEYNNKQVIKQEKFENRFDKPNEKVGEDARVEAEKAYQVEIEKTKELILQRESAYSGDKSKIAADKELEGIKAYRVELENAKESQGNLAASAAEANAKISASWQEGATQAVYEYINATENSAKRTHDVTTRMLKGMENALVNFTKTGKLDFKSFAASVIEDLIRIQVQEALSKSLGMLGGFLKSLIPSANGHAFNGGDVPMFANGGAFTNSVVSEPTAFPMGLMGEAGPEAIMPLSRDSSGRLGVTVSGGSSGQAGDTFNVSVNVDAKGGSVQGDEDKAKQLGKGIEAAIRQVLLKEKRPGGLLA